MKTIGNQSRFAIEYEIVDKENLLAIQEYGLGPIYWF